MAEEEFMSEEAKRNVFRLLACAACCILLAWTGFFIAIIALLAANDTSAIRGNCRGLVELTAVSMITPCVFPAVFYCFVRPFYECRSNEAGKKDWVIFYFIACTTFLVACVYMIGQSWTHPRCAEALGDPPLLLWLLGVKAAMYLFGVLSSIVALYELER